MCIKYKHTSVNVKVNKGINVTEHPHASGEVNVADQQAIKVTMLKTTRTFMVKRYVKKIKKTPNNNIIDCFLQSKIK